MPIVSSRILLAISVIIALISALVTFSGWNMIDSQAVTENQNGIYAVETEPSQSLTLEGLSPQGESDLAIACSVLPEQC